MVGPHGKVSGVDRLERSRRHAHSTGSAVLLCALFAICIAGCETPKSRPVRANESVELTADQGYLIVHVDTDIALDALVMSGKTVARSLGKGRHIWMIRVNAGRYRWKRIALRDPGGRRPLRVEIELDAEFRFAVEAGKINYPGELVIRSASLSRWGDGDVEIRNVNHSAMAVRALLGSNGPILNSFPLRYAGSGDDAFFAHYMRARDEAGAIATGNADSVTGSADSVIGGQAEAP
jgi:hypothetical protein